MKKIILLLLLLCSPAYATNLVNINGNAIGSIVNFGGNAVSGINNVDGNGVSTCATCTLGGSCMVNQETCDFNTRVLADSGTVVNAASVDAAYTLAKDGTNGFTIKQWCSADFAWKASTSSYAGTVYCLGSSADLTGHGSTTYRPVWTANVIHTSYPSFAFTSSHVEYFSFGNIGMADANSGFVVSAGNSSNAGNNTMFFWGVYSTGATNQISLSCSGVSPYYVRLFTANTTESTLNLVTSNIAATSTTHYLWNWKVAATTWHIVDFSKNVTTFNGSASYSLTPAGASGMIGATNLAGSGSLTWNGYITEWLILASEYTAGQYTAITNYFNNKYALY